MYWSDGTEDQINVCNLDGESCKPVVYDRLKIKRMSFLQIDSLNARLYFDNQDTRINSSPRRIIESVSLDGTDRKMLIGKDFLHSSFLRVDTFIFWTFLSQKDTNQYLKRFKLLSRFFRFKLI